jgi:hypothetical protein
MLKKLALTTAVTLGLAAPVASLVWAQDATTAAPRIAPAGTSPITPEIDGSKLIGHSVQDEDDNQTVGKIASVIIGADGQVQKVVLGVGGFLGIGAKDVAIEWRQLHIADNGNKITMNADKDQLTAMPDYVRPDEEPHGSIWTASGNIGRGAPGITNSGITSSGSSGATPSTGSGAPQANR